MLICEIVARPPNRTLKTQKGSVIKRSKYGVGKEIGGCVYVHKMYADLFPDINGYLIRLNEVAPNFEFNIIKYCGSKDSVSFLNSPNFDTADEPTITDYVVVNRDGSHKKGKSNTIYHHKWLFVRDDYPNFDVDEAFARSRDWLQLPDIDFTRIGKPEVWNKFLDQSREKLPSTFKFESVSNCYYDGPPLETGSTSTNFPVAPAIKWLEKKGLVDTSDTVLDYGAGKYARNANHLRSVGIKTYAFDPYNGYSEDGWTEVSTALPNMKFDVGFSAFVLNVVPKHIEEKIVNDVNSRCSTAFHIVRNMDVFNSVKNALLKNDRVVMKFFKEQYVAKCNITSEEITDAVILDFCKFGVQTSKGFQRICYLEDYGYRLLYGSSKSSYKVYGK
jgi:hypothetical protein